MPPSAATFARASRPLFSSTSAAFQTRQGFARASPFRRAHFNKRWQSSTAGAAGEAPASPAQASWFKRMWDSPIGIKTVHFWAPVMKWALVMAGVSDFLRPAEKLSLTQNGALTATGFIWTRWCLIIKPRNILLAAANFFLGFVGIIQVGRILVYQSSQKTTVADEVKEGVETVKGGVETVKEAVKSS